MSKLEIKDLSKSFGETKVLDNINLTVNSGEFLVLVGPSGSGKSTILRIIAGLEEPTYGEIKINNTTINHLLPKDRDIAMVFQNYALYPHMSIFDNLAFPLKMKKISKEIIEKSVSETAEQLGIKNYLKKQPKELSGGERQRVALGRAIIRKPQLFLMDEPLSNLDAKLRTQMRSELLKLHKTLGRTFIYVTHDQIEALTMGSKIVVLDHGKVQQIGTPQEIYTTPSNTFVAGFLGSPAMNFFDIKIINNKKILFCEELKEVNLSNNFSNQDFILGIRPEHLNCKQNSDITFQGTIELIEMLGHEYLLYASITNKTPKITFCCKITNNLNVRTNEQVTFSIDLNKAHYFDKSTNKRITL